MSEAAASASGPRDPVLDFVLGPLVGSVDPEEARQLRVEAALEALDPPTRHFRPRSGAPTQSTAWVATAEPDEVIDRYRAALPARRARLLLALARERAPEWARAWDDVGDERVAHLVRAVLAWKASVAAGDAGRWDADTTATHLLEEAQRHTRAAAEADPDDITPWILAQAMLARPQHTRVDLDALRAGWEAIDPWDEDGHRGWCECMLRGGFGTPAEVSAELQRLAVEAPPGHAALGAVAVGLCLWDARDLEGGVAPAWEPASPRRDILARAYARGPLDARWMPGPDEGYVRNCFAYGLACSDDARAWDEFAALEGYWTLFPWELIDHDALGGYLSSRAWAAQAAGILDD